MRCLPTSVLVRRFQFVRGNQVGQQNMDSICIKTSSYKIWKEQISSWCNSCLPCRTKVLDHAWSNLSIYRIIELTPRDSTGNLNMSMVPAVPSQAGKFAAAMLSLARFLAAAKPSQSHKLKAMNHKARNMLDKKHEFAMVLDLFLLSPK